MKSSVILKVHNVLHLGKPKRGGKRCIDQGGDGIPCNPPERLNRRTKLYACYEAAEELPAEDNLSEGNLSVIPNWICLY